MILVLIGAINWGLTAVVNWNVVTWLSGIFGEKAKVTIAKIIYIAVALSAIALIFEPKILIQ